MEENLRSYSNVRLLRVYVLLYSKYFGKFRIIISSQGYLSKGAAVRCDLRMNSLPLLLQSQCLLITTKD